MKCSAVAAYVRRPQRRRRGIFVAIARHRDSSPVGAAYSVRSPGSQPPITPIMRNANMRSRVSWFSDFVVPSRMPLLRSWNGNGFITYNYVAPTALPPAAAQTPQERTALERQIAATDTQIDRLVYDLYGLTADEIRIVEQRHDK